MVTIKFEYLYFAKGLCNPPPPPPLGYTTIIGDLTGLCSKTFSYFCLENKQNGHGLNADPNVILLRPGLH